MRTIWGTPLEPGERVFYYHRIPSLFRRLGQAVFGIITIPMLGIGFFFLYWAIFHRRHFNFAQAMTNRRLIIWDGRGDVSQTIRWEQVSGMISVSGRSFAFGVRDRVGHRVMFTKDLFRVETIIQQALHDPRLREGWCEVPFDAVVQ